MSLRAFKRHSERKCSSVGVRVDTERSDGLVFVKVSSISSITLKIGNKKRQNKNCRSK